MASRGRKAARRDGGGSQHAVSLDGLQLGEEDERKEEEEVVTLYQSVPAGNRRKRKTVVLPPTSVAQKLEMIKESPSRYCIVEAHPVSQVVYDQADSIVCVVDLQFSAKSYVAMPKGFFSLCADVFDLTVAILRIFAVFTYVMCKARAEEFVMEAITEEDDRGKPKVIGHKKKRVEKNSINMFFERVPHKDHPRRFVAYRLRIVEFGSRSNKGLVEELHHLLSDNNEALLKQARKPAGRGAKIVPDVDSISLITTDTWSKICRAYNPELWDDASATHLATNITDPDSPCNPAKVFSMRTNCRLAKNMDAHPDYCRFENYATLAVDKKFIFPQGGINAWKIDPSEFNVVNSSIGQFFFPCEEQDPRHMQLQRLQFQKEWGIADPVKANKLFNSSRSLTAASVATNDFNALVMRVRDDDSELRSKFRIHGGADDGKLSPQYYAARRTKAIDEWLPVYCSVNSPTGNCGPVIQQISKYMEAYLQVHDNILAEPHVRSFKNLGRFANMRAEDAIAMDQVQAVLTAHQDCLLLCYSVLHVYRRVEMNIHHMMLGAAGIGKSFAIAILAQVMIPETFVLASYPTPRAFAIPGNQNAMLTILMEDAPSSIFGMQGGSGGGGKASASSDVENIFKQLLTSKTIQVPTVVFDPVRRGELVKAETCVQVICAMNDASNLIPLPVKDRFCVTQAAQDNSSDFTGSSVLAVMQRVKDPNVQATMANMSDSFRRKQCIIMNLYQLEACGINQNIDTSLADLFFQILTDIAAKQNMRLMDRKRPVERFRMLCSVMTMLNIVDILYDSPGAPFAGKEHDISHFLMAEKYGFVTLQIAVYCAGMLARQWQDDTQMTILEAMLRCWFPNSRKLQEDYATMVETDHLAPNGMPEQLRELVPPPQPDKAHVPAPPLPGQPMNEHQKKAASNSPEIAEYYALSEQHMDKVDSFKNWMYASAAIGGPDGAIPPVVCNRPSGPTTEEIVDHLAKQLQPKLTKRYIEAEVRAKLGEMLKDTVTVTRVQHDEHGKETREGFVNDFPKLAVDRSTVRLAFPVIQQMNGYGSETFRKCVEDTCAVLAVATDQPLCFGDMLYGECRKEEGARFVMRVMPPTQTKQQRKAMKEDLKRRQVDVKKLTRRVNSGYAPPAVQRVMQANQGATDDAYFAPEYMMRLFPPETPWSTIDCNVDSLAATKRAHAVGLSFEDQHRHPSSDPMEQDIAFAELEQTTAVWAGLLQYPQCFTGMTREQVFRRWEEKHHRDPSLFSLAKHKQKLETELKTRPNLYQEVLLRAIGAQQRQQQQQQQEQMPPLERPGDSPLRHDYPASQIDEGDRQEYDDVDPDYYEEEPEDLMDE